MASPHADEQGRAVTAGALHTAARTGHQRCSFHQAGVMASLLRPLSWPASPTSVPATYGHGLETLRSPQHWGWGLLPADSQTPPARADMLRAWSTQPGFSPSI